MGDTNVESFRLDFDDGGMAEKAEAAASGGDRLDESLGKVASSAGKAEQQTQKQSSGLDKFLQSMRAAEQAVGGWVTAQARAFAEGTRLGIAEAKAEAELRKRTAATQAALGPEEELTRRIREHTQAEAALSAKAKEHAVSIAAVRAAERAAAKEAAESHREQVHGAKESREALGKLSEMIQEATGVNLGFAQGMKGMAPDLMLVGGAVAVVGLAIGALREKFAEAERVAAETARENDGLRRSLEHLEEKTHHLTRGQAALLAQLREQEKIKAAEKLEEMGHAYDWLNVKAELFAWIAGVVKANLEFLDIAIETAIEWYGKFIQVVTLGAIKADQFAEVVGKHVPKAAEALGGAVDFFTAKSKKAEEGMEQLRIGMQNFGAEGAFETQAKKAEELSRAAKKHEQDRKAAQAEFAALEKKENETTLAGKIANYEAEYRHFEDLERRKLISTEQLGQARRMIDQREQAARDAEAQKYAQQREQIDNKLAQLEAKNAATGVAAQVQANNAEMESFRKMIGQKGFTEADYLRARRALLAKNADLLLADQVQKEKAAQDQIKAFHKKTEDEILGHLSQSRNKGAQAIAKGIQTARKVEEIYHAWKRMQDAMDAVSAARAAASAAVSQASASGAKIAAETPSAAMNSYSAMASIPFVGPILGFIAAAAAIVYGMEQQNKAKSAASSVGAIAHGGLDRVPDDMTIFVKREEMIVPPDPAKAIRAFVEQSAINAEKVRGGGGQQFNFNAPWFGGAEAMREVRREGAQIARRTTSARRRP